MNRLFLVRHGQTAWNIAGRAQGHTDIPLDPMGQDQASRLCECYADAGIDRIFSSDLDRCASTVRPLAEAAKIPMDLRADLRERGFGAWEGENFLRVAELMNERAASKGVPSHEVRPPNGESFVDVWERLDTAVQAIEAFDGRLLVATHGGTGTLLLAKLLHGTIETARSFSFANTGVCELHRRADGLWRLMRYNDTRHLSGGVLAGSLDGVSR